MPALQDGVDPFPKQLSGAFDTGRALQRGSALKKLTALITRKGMPDSDVDVPLEYPEDLQPARRATGFGLYRLLGIERTDHAARDLQMRRNYQFFGAPIVGFVFVHRSLGLYSALDAGLFLQSLMLSAHAHGLGTCAQGALAVWAGPVRALFEVPPNYRLIVGVSLGYPSDSPVNGYNPGRTTAAELQLVPRSRD